MKKSITIILSLLIFAGGYAIGRRDAIHSAELLDVTAQEYHISFDNEVHSYTFEEVQ